MYLLLFLAYLAVEVAALAWLGATLGAGTTVLLFLAVTVAGYAVLAAQGRRAVRNLTGLRGGVPPAAAGDPGRALTDGALIGAGAALVLVPGLITTAVGIVLLLPTRAAVRPLVTRLAARRLARTGGGFRAARLVVVDGQVVEHTVVGADPAPTGPTGAAPGTVLEGEIVDTPPRPGLR